MMRAVGLAVLTLASGAVEPRSGDPFAGMGEVAIAYYPVSGNDAAAIARSIEDRRMIDPNDGTPVASLSNWHYGWHIRTRGVGAACTVTGVAMDFTAIVRLPRLSDPVSPALRRRWDRYVAALALHEAGHVRSAFDRRDAVAAAIRAAPCDTANAAGQAAIAGIDAEQLAYDQATRHGATQGAVFP